jgi:hypothetical protein
MCCSAHALNSSGWTAPGHPGGAMHGPAAPAHDHEVIKEMGDMPAGVVGFETVGTLKAEDYRDVVLPALQHASADGDVRFVVVIPEFHGMSGGAMWEDLKVGVEHFRAWKRMALVTDVEWMKHTAKLFGWMMPGELRHFPLADRDEAIAWVSSPE